MERATLKNLIACIGGALALGCAGWAMYLDIASDGKDPMVMRWFGGALGVAALSWAFERIVTKYAPPANSNANSN
jgi:hypothetical protein